MESGDHLYKFYPRLYNNKPNKSIKNISEIKKNIILKCMFSLNNKLKLKFHRGKIIIFIKLFTQGKSLAQILN